MAKSIMIQGTMSNAGKSILTAALCRIFAQDGYRVAPFKAQNMALNSFITADGCEMGRAQVMQAEAATVLPDVRMNPILLKPTSDSGSQVIINGHAVGYQSAQEYYAGKQKLHPIVREAYESLAAEYDIIVIEGAGSPAEINLKKHDLVNMGMAKIAKAPVLLVGDIDRGGVFAALYGTILLLDPEEQSMIRGVVINKFRGDVKILQPGLSMLEDLIHKPVLGVVPYTQLDIDDEDSLSERLHTNSTCDGVNIRIPCFPHLSNFTDFDNLSRIRGVYVKYVKKPQELIGADMIMLPGTKSTMEDLRWLRQNGMEAQILRLVEKGIPVFGICGGYQMMGHSLNDSLQTDGGGNLRGMNLLPIRTVFEQNKKTVQVTGQMSTVRGIFSELSGAAIRGYEIHTGRSELLDNTQSLITLADGKEEGCQRKNCYGSYVHGLFDMPEVARAVVQALLQRKGRQANDLEIWDAAQYKQMQYDKLANIVRDALDMKKIYAILEAGI